MGEIETSSVGKITASFTHEFMNVLATIQQTSGLVEDLITMSLPKDFQHREKFIRSCSIITEQVRRGMEMSDRLNTFSHSMEVSEARIDLNEILDQSVFLMRRSARLKHVSLAVTPGEPPLAVTTDPFRLQLLIIACLEYLLSSADAEETITLQSREKGPGVSIQILRETASGTEIEPGTLPDELSQYLEILQNLGAGLGRIASGGRSGLELTLFSAEGSG